MIENESIEKTTFIEEKDMIIPFEEEYRKRFYELENQIFESNYWSEGKIDRKSVV